MVCEDGLRTRWVEVIGMSLSLPSATSRARTSHLILTIKEKNGETVLCYSLPYEKKIRLRKEAEADVLLEIFVDALLSASITRSKKATLA